jgi:site-specific recombinase XerD
MPGHRRGQAPRNKGLRYPPDPPSVEEIVLVMCHAGDRAHGLRLRGLIVVMWRAGLRISEALALTESDLDEARGAILVRHGKGNKRREVGMDQWGWEELRHAHAVEMAREGVPLNVIQRQLGHANVGITSLGRVDPVIAVRRRDTHRGS